MRRTLPLLRTPTVRNGTALCAATSRDPDATIIGYARGGAHPRKLRDPFRARRVSLVRSATDAGRSVRVLSGVAWEEDHCLRFSYLGSYNWTLTPPGMVKCVTRPKPSSVIGPSNTTPLASSCATVSWMWSQ